MFGKSVFPSGNIAVWYLVTKHVLGRKTFHEKKCRKRVLTPKHQPRFHLPTRKTIKKYENQKKIKSKAAPVQKIWLIQYFCLFQFTYFMTSLTLNHFGRIVAITMSENSDLMPFLVYLLPWGDFYAKFDEETDVHSTKAKKRHLDIEMAP